MSECGWNNPGPYTNQIINNIDSKHKSSVSITILPLKSVPGLYTHCEPAQYGAQRGSWHHTWPFLQPIQLPSGHVKLSLHGFSIFFSQNKMTVRITSLNHITENFRFLSRTADEALVSPQDDATAVIKLFIPAKGIKWCVAGTHDIFDIDMGAQKRSTDRIEDHRLQAGFKIQDETVKLQDMKPAFLPIYDDDELEDPEHDFDKENLLGEPLFFEGEAWPLDASGRSFSFYAQFWDPDKFYGEFIQIFIADLETGGDAPEVYIRHLTQKDFDTKRVIRIPTPADVPNADLRHRLLARKSDYPMEIIGWEIRDTFYSAPVKERLTARGLGFKLPKKLHMIGYHTVEAPELIGTEEEDDIPLQLGGVPASAQGNDFSQDDVYFNDIYNSQWGDSGVLHYTSDGRGTGDMA